MAKVTIFGLAGTGTTTVGKLLAARLKAPFLSSGVMFRAKAAELRLSLYEFVELCNKDDSYNRALDTEVERYGKANNHFVFESRLAWHFIPDSFKVKIICDLKTRIERVARRDNESFEEKKKKTLFREEAGRQQYKACYNIIDFAPDTAFNLVLDSSKTTPEALVEEILMHIQ
jgi:cytidylate kinase